MKKIHFSIEERILKRAEYPHLKSHQKLHKYMINQMRMVRRESIENNDPDIALMFLREWWKDHICVQDRRYAEYISKIQ